MAMPVDVLQVQLASAIQRFNSLRRRSSDREDSNGKLIGSALRELERALEEVRVAQEQLLENRSRMEALQADLAHQCRKYWQLFDEMPHAYLLTKADSTIVEANRAASELFNVSQRFLVGKTFSVFVGENRIKWLRDVSQVGDAAEPLELAFRLRPRERAPLPVRARIAREESLLRWVVTPDPRPALPQEAL